VRGDHRADQGPGQLTGDDVGVEVRGVEQLEGGRQAALLRRRALDAVEPAAALVVQVLGEVGQQREVAERADDVVGRPDVEGAQPGGDVGAVDLRAAQPEGLHAGGLDEREDVVPRLLADDLAEDPAQQPDVLAQRGVGGVLLDSSVVAQVGDVDGGFGHPASIDRPCDVWVSWQGPARCPWARSPCSPR